MLEVTLYIQAGKTVTKCLSFCCRESWPGQSGGLCADFLSPRGVDVRVECLQWGLYPLPGHRRCLGEAGWHRSGSPDAGKPQPCK